MIRNFVLYWLPPIALMVAIFIASSQQSIAVTHVAVQNFLIFKSLHVAEYGALTFLFFRALNKTTKLNFDEQLWCAVILGFSYGILDEIHQSFVPTRSGAPRDIFINGIGIFGVYYIVRHYFEKFKKYMY